MWFRRDLRLSDNPALLDAADRDGDVLPLFVLDPALWRPSGPSRRHYLAESLEADRQLGHVPDYEVALAHLHEQLRRALKRLDC